MVIVSPSEAASIADWMVGLAQVAQTLKVVAPEDERASPSPSAVARTSRTAAVFQPRRVLVLAVYAGRRNVATERGFKVVGMWFPFGRRRPRDTEGRGGRLNEQASCL
jgi:hypothetical protein